VVIALAKELDRMAWWAWTHSGAALAVARDNARRHAVLDRVHFLQADLLAALKPTAALPCWWPTCLIYPGRVGTAPPGGQGV